MSRLSRIIAPMLHSAGLDVRAINGADGQVRELVITNPRQPGWGRVVINHEGHMEWGYWGQVHDDPGAATMATVVIAIMATPQHGHPDRPPQDHRRAASRRARPFSPLDPPPDAEGLPSLFPGRLVASGHRGTAEPVKQGNRHDGHEHDRE
jgi:hypothetical protein